MRGTLVALISATVAWALPILSLPPGVTSDQFRVTQFASNLPYTTGMQILPDNSLLVGVTTGSDYLLGGSGGLVRLTDPGNTGTAGAPVSVYSGFTNPVQSVKLVGNNLVAVSHISPGGAQITFLKIGANANDPYTNVGEIAFNSTETGLLHYITLETRPAGGGATDLFFSINTGEATAQSATVSGLINGSIPLNSVGRVTVTPGAGAPAVTGLQQIANGLRNPGGMVIQPSTGNMYINDNGFDDHQTFLPVNADELNRILAGAIGAGVANFGWPDTYTTYRTGVQVGATGLAPLAAFQPIPNPLTGAESLGVSEMALAPGLFPGGLNNGLFIAFYGTWEQGGANNTTGPLLYYDFSTGQYRPFITSGQAGIGHLSSLVANGNTLYIGDMSATGAIRQGRSNGVIYQIQAVTATPEPGTMIAGVGALLLFWWRRPRRGDDITLVSSIDGSTYSYGDSRMDDDSSLYGEARAEAQTIASGVEAGWIRLTETGWKAVELP